MAYGVPSKRTSRAAISATAAILLSLMLTGCSSLATFLADNVPQWAGGLPKDAPPRAGDPRYANYFRAQIAVRQSIEQRQHAGIGIDEQADRIERAETAGGLASRSVSARSVIRSSPRTDGRGEANVEAGTGFSLGGRTLY